MANNYQLIPFYQPIGVKAIEEVLADHDFWDWNSMRSFPGSPHQEVADIIIRGPVFPDRPLIELHHELNNDWYPLAWEFPWVKALAEEIFEQVRKDGERLGRVILTLLPPKSIIAPHVDEGIYAQMSRRFHFVVQSDPHCYFVIGDETLQAEEGGLYIVDTNKHEHAVLNHSSRPRVTLILDTVREP